MPGPGRPFQKGQSGNPGGQRKGLLHRVRELVEPDEIIAYALALMADEGAEHRDRLAAAKFLAERGWGKPHQSLTVDADVTATIGDAPRKANVGRLPDADLERLEGLLERVADADGEPQ